MNGTYSMYNAETMRRNFHLPCKGSSDLLCPGALFFWIFFSKEQ